MSSFPFSQGESSDYLVIGPALLARPIPSTQNCSFTFFPSMRPDDLEKLICIMPPVSSPSRKLCTPALYCFTDQGGHRAGNHRTEYRNQYAAQHFRCTFNSMFRTAGEKNRAMVPMRRSCCCSTPVKAAIWMHWNILQAHFCRGRNSAFHKRSAPAGHLLFYHRHYPDYPFLR